MPSPGRRAAAQRLAQPLDQCQARRPVLCRRSRAAQPDTMRTGPAGSPFLVVRIHPLRLGWSINVRADVAVLPQPLMRSQPGSPPRWVPVPRPTTPRTPRPVSCPHRRTGGEWIFRHTPMWTNIHSPRNDPAPGHQAVLATSRRLPDTSRPQAERAPSRAVPAGDPCGERRASPGGCLGAGSHGPHPTAPDRSARYRMSARQ